MKYSSDKPITHAAADAGNAEGDLTDLNGASEDFAGLLPAELIQPGEIIILLLKPSAWYIVLEPLRSLVMIVLITFIATYAARTSALGLNVRDTVLLGVAVLGVRLFWQFLEWLSRVYVLTDQRIIRVKGVLRIAVFETALKDIQHTECFFSIRERLLGLGSVTFATSGTAMTEAMWRMIANPLQVHQTVVKTLKRYR